MSIWKISEITYIFIANPNEEKRDFLMKIGGFFFCGIIIIVIIIVSIIVYFTPTFHGLSIKTVLKLCVFFGGFGDSELSCRAHN